MRRTALIAAALLAFPACASLRPLTPYHDALSPQEHLQLGMSYEAQKLPHDAEREYRAAAGRHRNQVPGLLALGNLLFAEGRLKEAERTLARAHRIVPLDNAAANNLAMVYVGEKKNLKKAEGLARQASGDARLKPYALDTLASLYLEENRVADARQAVAAARAAAPENDPAFLSELAGTERRIPAAP